MTPREPAVGARESATGAIYDLGYRGYDGPRLGRAAAIATLFWASLRAAFGLGRPARARIIPWGLSAFFFAPAVVAMAVIALVPGDVVEPPFNYDNYLFGASSLFALFVAAQAPELVSGDQRHRVLALYFSHALRRADYGWAKLGALAAALFVVGFVPMLVLFLGAVLASEDVVAALGDEVANLPQIIGAPIIYAVPLAAMSLAVAAWTPRRAYATGAIIAIFIVTAAVSGILGEAVSGPIQDWSQLLNPFVAADGTRDLLVGQPNPDAPIVRSGIDLWVFGVEAVLIAAIGAAAIAWRYRTVDP